jgi:3-hydroxybutyryl-CoA dehydratase
MGDVTGLPDHIVSLDMTVSPEAIRAYAEITRDYNPIHLDDAFAAASAFGRPIAHGTMSLNLILQAVERTLGEPTMRGSVTELKFLRPVFAGDRLEVGGLRRSDDPRCYDVWVRNQAGDAVIQGLLTLA